MTFKQATAAVGVAALTLLGTASQASAHAFSIGFENAGVGSVTVWLGTYQHSGHHLEGSLELEGVLGTAFGPTVVPFTQLTPDGVGNKPAGLVDGTTNFYVSTALGVPGPLVASDTLWNTVLCPACGPANHWEGVTFVGLSAGDYQFTYVPIANPSQEWFPYNPSLNGIFHLDSGVVGCGNPGAPACPPPPTGVPEPASMMLLFSGLAGLAAYTRRRVS